MQEEKIIDIKGTLEKFIEPEKVEISQEEEINQIQLSDIKKEIKKAGTGSSEDDSSIEDEEHLKRIKKELLASLERIKKLENQVYGEYEFEKNKIKIDKVDGGGVSSTLSREEKQPKEEKIQKERE